MADESVIDLVDDPRVEHRTAKINGCMYHFLYAEPKSGDYRGTVFLIHGWPDLSAAWRYQIPVLLGVGLRVVCPDMMGYGRTDAPQVPPESLSKYSFKRASDDIRELARQLGAHQIILGGHDWGGAVVYRCALWHPDLISHVFAVCTPYTAPRKAFVSLDEIVERAPQFGYQKHLASGEIEATIKSKEQIRQFLHGAYGASGPNREYTFDPMKGILFENLPKVGKTKLLSDREMDYYVEEYSRHGLHGPVNWYRTTEVNWREELELKTAQIEQPVLFIQANKDSVLLPSMAKGMEKHIPNLTRREVDTMHWALWQAPDATNGHIKDWIETVVFGGRSKM